MDTQHKVVSREEVKRGNAQMRLWLAAPDLLAALDKIEGIAVKMALLTEPGGGYFQAILDTARAAIAKAKGD